MYLKLLQNISDHKGSIISDLYNIQCLAKIAVMPVVRVCTAQSREDSLYCAVHTRTTGKYAATASTTSISTDTKKP